MPRPDRSDERRAELLPTLAETFAEHGYRGTTTAALAEATGLRENQLYRLWPSKKAMFLAVIEHLYTSQTQAWDRRLAEAGGGDPLGRVLDEEGRTRGASGLHRLVFAGLSETHDPEIRRALRNMYRRFHRYIVDVLDASGEPGDRLPSELVAWSLIGLGSLTNIGRELDLFPLKVQRDLFNRVGSRLSGHGSDDGG